MNILFVGDIFGSAGRRIVREHIGHVREAHRVELTIVNAENAAGGFGLTPQIAEDLFDLGADVLTMGNHVWDKKELIDYMNSAAPESPAGSAAANSASVNASVDRPRRVIRPANFAPGAPGYGVFEGTTASGVEYAVMQLQGRVFMTPIDDPFRTADALVAGIKAKVIVVDFHAEATSEKVAMGWYLDGRVTAVLGTHTHVPTADERILLQWDRLPDRRGHERALRQRHWRGKRAGAAQVPLRHAGQVRTRKGKSQDVRGARQLRPENRPRLGHPAHHARRVGATGWGWLLDENCIY